MAILFLLTLWLLGLSKPLSPRWLMGACAAVCTLFTMASGFLATVAVVGMTLVEVLKQRQNWRRHLPTGGCVWPSPWWIDTEAGYCTSSPVTGSLGWHVPEGAGKFLAAMAILAWYALFNLVRSPSRLDVPAVQERI